MSHVCAKPACTQAVHVWLDFSPVSQQVFERADRSDVSVGLCAAHAARFTVPCGWSFERHGSETTEVVTAPPVPVARRKSSRERPWFLESRDDESAPTDPGPSDPGVNNSAARELDVDPSAEITVEPTVGSLLHRAFHGPDRDVDAQRAVRDQLDELEPRRAARESGDYTAAELPFPPLEPEHRVAVS